MKTLEPTDFRVFIITKRKYINEKLEHNFFEGLEILAHKAKWEACRKNNIRGSWNRKVDMSFRS
jgi:hypothetical protein